VRIGISVDHAGRVGRRRGDLGATAGGLHEVDCTRLIADGVYRAARARGHEVIEYRDGEYEDRHRRADADKCKAYFPLHVNAGGGDYGLFGFHPESPQANGPALAAAMAEALESTASKILGRSYVCRVVKAGPPNWGNVLYTIKGLGKNTTPVAVCTEPFFLDTPEHRKAFANTPALLAIGASYVAGVEHWHSSLLSS
jgi:N-acetylmuramoyl-L-alanine amidase